MIHSSRSFLILAILLASPMLAWGQATITWASGAGTAWATATNWVGGVRPGSGTLDTNFDIAQWGAGSTGTQIQMNFSGSGLNSTNWYVGTLDILNTNTVNKTMGANTATAGVVQLNGAGPTFRILSNASSSLFTLAPLAGGSGTGMSLRLSAANSEISNSGGITISTIIGETAGGAKAITKTGTGTLTLSGANTFTGGISVNTGILVASTGGATGTHLGTGPLNIGTSATANATWNASSTAAVTVSNNIVLGSPSGATRYSIIKGTSGALDLTGIISGGSASTELFFNSSSGGDSTTQYILSGNNTFTAEVIRTNRGVLVVNNVNGLGASTNPVELDSNSNTTIGNLSFRVSGTFANPVRATDFAVYPIGVTTGNTAILTGPVTTQLLFQKVDAGTLVLAGTSTVPAAGAQVSAGVLQIGNGGTTGTIGAANDANVVVSTGAILTFNRSDAITASGIISGAGTLSQSGTGTTTLTAANTFTGPVNVNAGTLALGASGSLASTSINVNSGAAFDVSAVGGYTLPAGSNLTIGRSGTPANDFVGSGTIEGNLRVGGPATFRTATFSSNLTLNNSTSFFDLSNATTAGSGINDLVSVLGNFTLSGTNTINITQPVTGLATGNYTLFTYGGTLTGGAGNLVLAGGGGGTTRQSFGFDTATAGSVFLAVSGSPANLTWTGTNNSNWDLVTTTNNFTGAADNRFYNFDTVNFNNTASTGNVSLVGSLSPSQVVVDNSTLSYTFSGTGSIEGAANLIKSGTGTLILGTNNTYTGGTTINAGTLQLGTNGTSGSLVGNVLNNSTLIVNRSDASTLPGVISGTGTFSTIGSGTTTLSGANTYSGTTTVTGGGTLSVSADNNLGTAPATPTPGHLVLNNGTLSSSADMTLNANRGIAISNSGRIDTAAGTLTYNGILAGSGGLTKSGAGTLALGGTNTYTGGTSVNAGAVNFSNGSAFGTGPITFAAGVVNAAGAAESPPTPFFNNNTAANMTLENDIVLPTPSASTTYTIIKTGSGGQLNLTGNISGGNANTKIFLNTSVGGDNTTTYRLAGNNTFVATIEVWRGGVVVANANGLGASTNLIRFNSNNNTTTGDLRFETSASFANPIELVTGGGGPINTNANTVTLTGVLSGGYAGGLNKLGSGSLNLTANNTYTAGTTVNEGTLFVNNTTGSGTGPGAVTVVSAATIGGSGTVGTGAAGFNLNSGANLAPGNSVGTITLNVTSATLAGNYNFELGTAGTSSTTNGGSSPGVLVANTNHDYVTISGSANVEGLTVNPISLAGAGFNNSLPYSWTILSASGGLSGTANLGTPSGSQFTNLGGGNFTLFTGTNNLVLEFTPVPEPTTILGLAAMGVGFLRLRRRWVAKIA
ncbi:MAG: autotransporter-associated beta strand repeat-containing protein [Fimbriiglobus sp.]